VAVGRSSPSRSSAKACSAIARMPLTGRVSSVSATNDQGEPVTPTAGLLN
jgi:hypothetical protein